MRQILTDHAKKRRTLKRRADHVPLREDEAPGRSDSELTAEALIDLDRALDRLASQSERQARIVECRFYAGMTVDETAEALHVSAATVKRDWQVARAWLNRELA